MKIKIFDENNLTHELLFTTKQKTRLRNGNVFENKMSTDIKLSKTQIA